jgi:glycogen debranching enzyme
MLLIADLVKLSAVSFQQEIEEILSSLRVETEPGEIPRYLYLLDQLGLIAVKKYGHIDYYFGVDTTPEFMWYAPRTPMDRLKLAERLHADFPIGIDTEKRRAFDAHTRPRAGVAR